MILCWRLLFVHFSFANRTICNVVNFVYTSIVSIHKRKQLCYYFYLQYSQSLSYGTVVICFCGCDWESAVVDFSKKATTIYIDPCCLRCRWFFATQFRNSGYKKKLFSSYGDCSCNFFLEKQALNVQCTVYIHIVQFADKKCTKICRQRISVEHRI